MRVLFHLCFVYLDFLFRKINIWTSNVKIILSSSFLSKCITSRRRFLNPILVTVDVLPFRRTWCHSFLSLHFTRPADRTRNNIHRKKRKRITHTGATCTDSRRSFLVCRWSLFVQHSHVEFSSKFLLEFFTRERATKTLFRRFTCSKITSFWCNFCKIESDYPSNPAIS